jgi:hypothetical protein
MTLIFCLANEDYTILVSDRRRSFVGQPPDEESNKALVLNLFDARLAVAFTGLASTPNFQTSLWLAEALSEAARPEPLVEPTMARFCEIASRDIKNVALSAQDDPSVKRLTIFAAGYQYLDEGSRAWYFRVSNFEGEELYPKPKQLPDDDFSLVWARQQTPTTTPYGFVVAGGTTRGIPSGSMLQLRRLVAEKRPPRALVDKAVEVIQAAADAPASRDKVGKQCTSIVLPQDPAKPGQVEYHSANLARQVFLPDYIRTYEAQGGGYGALIIRSEGFALEDEAGNRMIVQVPKVGRNKPCPCGSGRKYKQCHGNRREPGWRIQLGGSGDDQHGQDVGDASGSESPH